MRRYLVLLVPVLLLLAADQKSADDAAKKAKQEKKAKQDAKKNVTATGAVADRPIPVIAWIYPAGGRRGTTVEVSVSGTNIVPDEVILTGGGVSARLVASNAPPPTPYRSASPNQSGELKSARIALEIAADAEPGMRELRVMNGGGVSNRFRFVVSDLPEIAELEPNSLKTQAQRIESLPVVINGQVMEADRDYYQFEARAGQTLVCKVDARRLLPFIADAVPGWFDPVLAIYDANGRQIEFADDFRVQPDPKIFFRVPRDGRYLLEVRDVIFRGRGDFVYRLSIGELPEVTHVFPLGGQRGTEVPVELFGVHLQSRLMKVKLPDAGDPVMRVTADALPFAISELSSIREAEPNDSEAHAQRVHAPVVVDGRIGKAGESDYFAFTANRGARLVMEVLARRLDSPLDSILTLYGPNHTVLSENDDWTDPMNSMAVHHSDSRIVFTFPRDGEYFLRLRDVQGNGGEEYAYRLSIAPLHPDFHLRISPDNPQLASGDTAAITVSAVRRDEFGGDIQLSVEDLPEGFEASDAVIPAGQNEGRLTITAPADAKAGILAPSVYGTAVAGKDTVRRKAETAEAVMQAFAYTHLLPTEHLYLAVIPPSAFRLSSEVSSQVLEVKPESETPIRIRILRQNGVTGGVAFAPLRIAANTITTKSVFAAPGQDEATIVLSVAKEAKVGLRQNVIISGVMRAGPNNITRYARAIPVRIVQ